MRSHSPILLPTLVAAVGLVAIQPARAADPATVMVAADVVEKVVSGLGVQGWYLRGDVGYSNVARSKMQVSRDGVLDDYLSSQVAKKPVMTIGVGGHFTNWLRADVTLSYRDKANLNGIYSSAAAGRDPNVGREETTTKLSSLAAMFNVYADLGTWSGFTPYIGAGVGFSRNTISNYSGTYYIGPAHPAYGTVCGGPVLPPAVETCASPSRFAKGTRTGLAWALMAGTAVEISPQLKFDLGYRYMNYGKATTGADAVALAGAPPATIKLQTKELSAHEVRLGLRYMFR
ncbi:MAG: outer membrane protein [Beijerinckiaceae bacterium]